MQELTSEITKMRTEINDKADDHAAYQSFEKKAEALAKDLKVASETFSMPFSIVLIMMSDRCYGLMLQ